MKISEKYRPLLIPVGTILVIVLFSVLFIPSQFESITKTRRLITKYEKETKDLKTKYLLISSLDEEDLKVKSISAIAGLPETKNVPYILQGLRNAVSDAGFVIKDLKFSPGEITKEVIEEEGGSASKKDKIEEKKIDRLPVETTVVGPFDNINELFEGLTETAPIFQIENFSVTSAKGVSTNVGVELKLATFYSPPIVAYVEDAIKLEDLVLSEEETQLLETLSKLKLPIVESLDVVLPKKEGQNPFL